MILVVFISNIYANYFLNYLVLFQRIGQAALTDSSKNTNLSIFLNNAAQFQCALVKSQMTTSHPVIRVMAIGTPAPAAVL